MELRHGLGLGVSLVLAGCGGLGAAGSGPAGVDRLAGAGAALAHSAAPAMGAAGVILGQAAGTATARQGLGTAANAAQGWDFGAQLGKAEGTAIDAGYMLGDWSYTFYAPGKKTEALLVIWDGANTRSFKVRKEPGAMAIFGGTFNIDSDQAVAIARKNGLRSGKVLRLELSQNNPQLRLQWSLMAPEGEFAIDATTGQLLKSPDPR